MSRFTTENTDWDTQDVVRLMNEILEGDESTGDLGTKLELLIRTAQRINPRDIRRPRI